jgi:hypothetical protein
LLGVSKLANDTFLFSSVIIFSYKKGGSYPSLLN